MNILFVLRADAKIKGGGDIVQAENYQKVLESAFPCHVKLIHELSSKELYSTQWDMVHIFNISRIYECIFLLKGVKYKKAVLSPIMQPSFDLNLKVFLKSWLRLTFLYRRIVFLRRSSATSVLDLFSAFVFLSRDEKNAFYAMFPLASGTEAVVFHNGVDKFPVKQDFYRFFDYLIVGRIEPKKRVVEALDVLHKVENDKRYVAVLGGINWYHPIYSIKFFIRVLKGHSIYLRKGSKSQVIKLMKSSKMLINFSELEVSPLVDLEALACGCSVVSTIYSFTHISEFERFVRVDVLDEHACISAINKLDHCDSSTQVPNIDVRSWGENSFGYKDLVFRLVQE